MPDEPPPKPPRPPIRKPRPTRGLLQILIRFEPHNAAGLAAAARVLRDTLRKRVAAPARARRVQTGSILLEVSLPGLIGRKQIDSLIAAVAALMAKYPGIQVSLTLTDGNRCELALHSDDRTALGWDGAPIATLL